MITNIANEKKVRSFDGVEIVCSVAGDGSTSLLFIHGGLANRGFWKNQLATLSDQYHLIAVDLAGHGDSGRNREKWSIGAFAEDVKAVAEELDLRRIVLIGSSLGGPVALHAAALLKGRTIGVIAVDTLQDASHKVTPEQARANADRFRNNFEKACREMAGMLFHPGQEQKLQEWAVGQMLKMPQEVVTAMLEGFGGFDIAKAIRAAGVPIRAINGDLYPTSVELNRRIANDFEAVIMEDAGHYPMLERPEEFNTHLQKIVRQLEKMAG